MLYIETYVNIKCGENELVVQQMYLQYSPMRRNDWTKTANITSLKRGHLK